MPHLNYYLDLCVEVYIIHSGKVLLRKHDKYNKWLAVGGHVDPGEDLITACHREVMEEVGLEIELFNPYCPLPESSELYTSQVSPCFTNRHSINDQHDHVAYIFFAKSSSDIIDPQYEGDISDECRWLSFDELQELKDLNENIKFYAVEVLKHSK